MEPQTFHLLWQGIEIEIVFTPRRWSVIDHLDIRSVRPERAPLPITGTGYLSHFMQLGTVEAQGGDVEAQVLSWLNEAAIDREWLSYVESRRQGELF